MNDFISENTSSIGLNSGEYGGINNTSFFDSFIISNITFDLWNFTLINQS